MRSLENKLPPPLVAVFFACIAWLVSGFGNAWGMSAAIQLFFVIGFFCSGIFIALWALVSFKLSKTSSNPLNPEIATHLVQMGVFRFSRNPMYLGLASVLIAWCFYLGALASFLSVLGFLGFMQYFQILPEERALEKLFGNDYVRYKSRVRRWL